MTENLVQYPDAVKFWPLVGLKSFHAPGAGGAWRAFVLAKNLSGGDDEIERDHLTGWLKHLHISDKQVSRWLNAARNFGLFSDVQRKSGKWVFVLISNEKAAKILECESIGKPVLLLASLLFGRGWKAHVFASFESTFNGRLISRRKQAEISGVKEVTQRAYDRQAGVERKKNFAISNMHANGYSAIHEFGTRAAPFKYWDKKTHQLKLAWRLPDCRRYPMLGVDGSFNSARTLSLFNRTEEQYKATVKKLSKSDSPINEVYLYSHTSHKGADMWFHMPLREKGGE